MAAESAKASTPRVVFDTDVLIWYFRGDEGAQRFLARVLYENRAVSSLTVMELIQGCRRQDELRAVKGFIAENIPLLLHPDEAICIRAMALLEEYAFSMGVRMADALIAATALDGRHLLATANVRHYRMISGLDLLPFKPG